ncbi:MAG: metallophosphoesterase [Nanopusillaceae archaeon]
MKFIHVSDTHLGCEIPVKYREIRKMDFLNAFKQVVDFAIKEKVNFIIHSGDFLDDYFRISSKIFLEILDLLFKLKENNIPFFFIKGNHDNKGQKQNVIEIIKKFKLIEELNPLEPKVMKDFYIYGISEPSNIGGEELKIFYEKRLKEVKVDKTGFSIFLFHGVSTAIPGDILKGYMKDPRVINHDFFPKVDLYGFGHFHTSFIKKDNSILSLPGSTERTEISEYEEKSSKGFFYFKDTEYEFINLNVRKVTLLEKRVEKEDDLDEIVKKIIEKSKDHLIKLKILYSRVMYDLIRKNIDNLLSLGYMIIDELYPEDYNEEINIMEDKVVFEDIIEKMIISENDKKELINLYNKIKYLFEEYYSDRTNSLERIRESLFKELI